MNAHLPQSDPRNPPCTRRYGRRTVVAGLLSSMELYLLNDTSPDLSDTWQALDRAVEGSMTAVGVLDAAGKTFGAVRDGAITSILSIVSSRK